MHRHGVAGPLRGLRQSIYAVLNTVQGRPQHPARDDGREQCPYGNVPERAHEAEQV